jgi:putative nucleotidyltransferase with HDIG domain
MFKIANDILKNETIDTLRRIVLFSLWGLAITVLAIFVTLFISLFLTRIITKPIDELVKVTQAISERNFDHGIKVRSYTEIKELIDSLNVMTKKLRDFERETKSKNLNLAKIARKRARELSYIYRIGREVSSTLELNEVLNTIVKGTTEVLDLKICAILLVDETIPDRLKVSRMHGVDYKQLENQYIKQGEGISGWVWQNKQSILIKDVNQDSRFCARDKERYYTGSLISVPLESKGKIIGIINGNNKTNGELFKEEDLLLLKEIAVESAIAIENALLYKNLKDIYVHTISALASALEAKDRYTRSHSENVTKFAVAIAEELCFSAEQIEVIRQACQLHDLGKIGIHDYILTKTGKLSAEEWDEIKLHSLRGAQILQPIGFLTEVAELVKQHHERFDGKGYPYQLNGQDIQLGARIMAVADAFDAMISERPYRKKALSVSQAIEELKLKSGSQFDPQIVKVFLQTLKKNPELVKGIKT